MSELIRRSYTLGFASYIKIVFQLRIVIFELYQYQKSTKKIKIGYKAACALGLENQACKSQSEKYEQLRQRNLSHGYCEPQLEPLGNCRPIARAGKSVTVPCPRFIPVDSSFKGSLPTWFLVFEIHVMD